MSVPNPSPNYTNTEAKWYTDALNPFNLFQWAEELQFYLNRQDLWHYCFQTTLQFARSPESVDFASKIRRRNCAIELPELFYNTPPALARRHQQIRDGFLNSYGQIPAITVDHTIRCHGNLRDLEFPEAACLLSEYKHEYDTSRFVAGVIYNSLSKRIQQEHNRRDLPLKMLMELFEKYDKPMLRREYAESELINFRTLLSQDCVTIAIYLEKKQEHIRRAGLYGEYNFPQHSVLSHVIDCLSGKHEYIKTALRAYNNTHQPTTPVELEFAVFLEISRAERQKKSKTESTTK